MTDDRKSADPRIVTIDGETYYLTGEQYMGVNYNGDNFTGRMTLEKIRHHEPGEEIARRNSELHEIVRLAAMGVTLPGITEDNFNAEYQGVGVHPPRQQYFRSTRLRNSNVWNRPAEDYFRFARDNALNEPATHRPGQLTNVPFMDGETLRALGVPENFLPNYVTPERTAVEIQLGMLGALTDRTIRGIRQMGVGLGNMAGLNGAPPAYRDGWIQERLEDPNISDLHRELYMDLLYEKERKMEFGSRRVDKKRKKLKRDGF